MAAELEIKKWVEDPQCWVCFCDGSSLSNPGPGGAAALLVTKGKTSFELGDFPTARAAYTRAVSVGEGKKGVFLADAYLGLAVIATREQKWEDAREQFSRLVALNPADGTTHANLAKVDLELGKIDDAVSHAEEAARSRGADEQVLYTLGMLHLSGNFRIW